MQRPCWSDFPFHWLHIWQGLSTWSFMLMGLAQGCTLQKATTWLELWELIVMRLQFTFFVMAFVSSVLVVFKPGPTACCAWQMLCIHFLHHREVWRSVKGTLWSVLLRPPQDRSTLQSFFTENHTLSTIVTRLQMGERNRGKEGTWGSSFCAYWCLSAFSFY